MSKNSWVIGDKELKNLLKEDQLGTRKYVDQLFNIITNLSDKELEKGFNIGLYGGWGSGKSSITKALKIKIENEYGNEFRVIYFDCWKYSNDDLRRSILLGIANKYDNNTLVDEIYKFFYADRGTLTEGSNKYDLKRLKENWGFIIFFLVIVGGITYFEIKYPDFLNNSVFKILGISSMILLSVLEIFNIFESKFKIPNFIKKILSNIDKVGLNDIKNLIPTLKVSHSITEGKIFSGEQFENLFNILIGKEIKGCNQFIEIKKIVKKENLFKDKKILFIFDNIDRCESSTVKEILMTIKTFLNQNGCVFLLPIDYDNVCESYEKNFEQGDEYLRKIFNLGINLKQPHYSKLSNLIIKLLETNLWKDNNGLGLNDNEISYIAYILSSLFADNPRKIKQFLNQIGAEYILYNRKKPILSILKENVIQTEIPQLYSYLTEDQNILFANECLESFTKEPNKYSRIQISERQQLLLHKLSSINEKLELFDDEVVKVEKAYHLSPENFIAIIKKDNLQRLAEDFLLSNIVSVRVGGIPAQIELLQNFIFYITEFGIKDVLYDCIFKKGSIFLDSQVLDIILTLDTKVLYKFITILGEKKYKIANQLKTNITKRFILKDDISIDLEEFGKLSDEIQDIIVDFNVFRECYKEEIEKQNFKELNYFKFLSRYPRFIDSNFINFILEKVDTKSFDFGLIKSVNLISIIAQSNDFTATILEKVVDIEERFYQNYKHIVSNYKGDNKIIVDSYLDCVKVIIQYGNKSEHDKIMDNIVNLYHSYNDSDFREKIYELFGYDFEIKPSYQRKYADIVIDCNDKENINNLIVNTINNGETRLGLNDGQVEKIINKISWEDDNRNGIIKSIWENQNLKQLFFDKINGLNDDNEKINKIKKLDDLNILSKDDKKVFGNKFTENLENWLVSGTLENMEKTADFIQEYKDTETIKYIDYNKILDLLNSFDMSKFGNVPFDDFVCYERKLEEAKKYLSKLKNKK